MSQGADVVISEDSEPYRQLLLQLRKDTITVQVGHRLMILLEANKAQTLQTPNRQLRPLHTIQPQAIPKQQDSQAKSPVITTGYTISTLDSTTKLDKLYRLHETKINQNGFALFAVKSHEIPAKRPKGSVPHGLTARQTCKVRDGIFYLSNHETLHNMDNVHQVPSLQSQSCAIKDWSTFLDNPLDSAGVPQYYMADIWPGDDDWTRQTYRLGDERLNGGDRLLSTRIHYPGIHSPYLYVADGKGAFFALHTEDFHLPSANFLHWGSPKVWIVIMPEDTDKLETMIASHARLRKCNSFVRHQSIFIPPTILRKCRIRHTIVVQKPGSLILLGRGTYHCG